MTTYLINNSRLGNIPVNINVLSNLYANQFISTGPLTWSISASNTSNATANALSIDSNTGMITLASNTYISDFVTVTTSNVLHHEEDITFRLAVAETPLIYNPGTIYAVGNEIQSIPPYTFSNMVPPERSGPICWDITELSGFAIDPTTGVLTYQLSNITGNQLLDISDNSWVLPASVFVSSISSRSVQLTWNSTVGLGPLQVVSNPSTFPLTLSSGGTFSGLTPNTAYSFTVSQATSFSITTLPVTISSLATGTVTSTSVALSWVDPPGGATYYSVVAIAAGSASAPQKLSSGGGTFTGLAPNTAYTFAVTSVGNGGTSTPINTASVTTAPAAVSSITVGSVSSNSVILSWPAVQGSTFYKIITNPFTSTQITNLTNYTFSNLGAGSNYTFIIQTSNAAGWVGPIANTTSTTTPTAVPGIQCGNITQTSVQLQYAAVYGATYYQITTTPVTNSQVASTSNYTFSNLGPGSNYSFIVTAGNVSGLGGATTSASITTTPAAVSGIQPVSITPSNVQLQYTAAYGTTSYIITTSPPTSTQITTGLNYIFSNLGSGSNYTFTVTSSNASGSGGAASASITTTPAAVSGIQPVAITTSNVQLQYTPVYGATSYRISTSPPTTTQVTTGSTYTFSNLGAGSNYVLTLTSLNISGGGGAATASITTVPSAVTNIQASAITPSNVQLQYAVAYGATSYSIATSPPTSTQITTGSNYTFSNLGSGSNYTLIVTSSNISGGGGAAAASITTTPAAVSGIQPVVITPSNVQLQYTSAYGATSYSITTSPPSTTQITTGSSYTFSNLGAGSNYTFTVTSSNTSGGGGAAAASITTTPGAVSGVQAYTITPSNVQLQYMAVYGVTSYSITTTPPTSTQITTGSNYTFSNLGAGSNYSFKVTSYNASGGGGAASSYITTTPAAVSSIQASTITQSNVQFQYTSAYGATSYSIVTSPPTTTQVTTGSNYTFSNLGAGSNYTFTVTSSNTSGGGGAASVSLTTLPDAVSGIQPVSITPSNVQLQYTTAYGATSYSIVTSPPTSTQVTTGSNYTFSNLGSGSNYTFTVTSSNIYGSGGAVSSSITTTPAAVSGIQASAITSSNMQLQYAAAYGATSYSITTSPPTSTQVTTGSTYTFSNLGAGSNYTVTVTSSNASGGGGSATAGPFTTLQAYAYDTLSVSAKASLTGVYAVKLLMSSYTGPVITVHTSFVGNTDFYADSYGNLSMMDGTSYANFVGTQTAYVSTWYDQSGRNKHATQPVATSQPKYDSVNRRLDFTNGAYLNLPSGVIASRNSQYSVTFKLGSSIANQVNTIYSAGGTTTNSLNALTANGAYVITWLNDDAIPVTPPALTSNDLVTSAYDGSVRLLYVNQTSVPLINSSIHIRNSLDINQTIGYPLNNQLYFITFANMSQMSADRITLESV